MFGDAVRDLLDPRLRGGVGSYGAAPEAVRAVVGKAICMKWTLTKIARLSTLMGRDATLE